MRLSLIAVALAADGVEAGARAAGSTPHVPAWVAVPVGMLAGIGLACLWWRAGRPGVPVSRRRIRRASLTLALMLVPILVVGASLVDANREPRRYIEVWMLAMVVLALVVLTAVVDAINSVRLVSAERRS